MSQYIYTNKADSMENTEQNKEYVNRGTINKGDV